MPSPPPCVGQFEVGDLTCNGDPDGQDEEDRIPCAWRNRCAGLQLHCLASSFSADEVVATLDYKTLVGLCEAQVEKHSISRGIPGGPEEGDEAWPGDEPPERQPEALEAKPAVKGKPKDKPKRTTRKHLRAPQTKGRRKPPRKKEDPKTKLRKSMVELKTHFELMLGDVFPERRIADSNKVLVKPGQFYCLDRTDGSQYVAWYCTMPKGRDAALAMIHFKPRLKRVHVEVPVAIENMQEFLGKDVFKRLKPETRVRGQFKTICKDLDKEGIGLLVESLRRLTDADLIALPE